MSEKSAAKHPAGLYVLFFTEMWERFGFYLMLGILYLYMTDKSKGGLEFAEGTANDIYGTYIALVYLTPFIGGLLADRIFGYRKTIIFGGALMGAGYMTLAIPGEQAFFVALGLIIAGNGFFKPNISTLLGNLYNRNELKDLKDSAYNIFYMGINIGAFVCNFVAAYMRNHYGWGAAFFAAGVGMFIGLLIFILNTRHVSDADVVKPANREDMPIGKIFAIIFLPALIFGVIGYFIGNLFDAGNLLGSKSNDAFLFACIPVALYYLSLFLNASAEDRKPIGALLYIFTVVVIFWAIFHQNGNVLTAWAEKNTTRQVPAAMESTLNSFGFVETVEAPAAAVEDQTSSEQTVTASDSAKQEKVHPYLETLPQSEWPAKGEKLSLINTELFQSLNPMFVVLFTPLLVGFLSRLKLKNREPSTPAKIALGLAITGLSTLVMIAAVYASSNGANKVSAIWLVGTYAVITIGELFLSPMGLSLVSKLSPPRLTALMMGGWFLSTSIGNKLSGVLGHLGSESEDKSFVFWINCAGAMFSAFLLFIFVKRIKAVVREKTGHD